MSTELVPISKNLTTEIPYSILSKLPEMPEEAQREFIDIYQSNRKSTVLGYIFHLFAYGSSYGYLNRWGMQILYWLTFGGLGIWWFIRLFTLPSSIKKHNKSKAENIFKDIILKWGASFRRKEKVGSLSQKITNLKPRPLKISFDPSNLSIKNLKKGYLIDFDLKTWEVKNEYQIDWLKKTSSKELVIINDLKELILNIEISDQNKLIAVLSRKSIHQIDSTIENQILKLHTPPVKITFEGKTYYKESENKGIIFNISNNTSPPTLVNSILYFDDSREYIFRIDIANQDKCLGYAGRLYLKESFSEILPK